MSDLETLLVLCVVGVIARKVIDTSKEWAAEEKFKSKAHQQLMDAWDKQAKKYDFYLFATKARACFCQTVPDTMTERRDTRAKMSEI